MKTKSLGLWGVGALVASLGLNLVFWSWIMVQPKLPQPGDKSQRAKLMRSQIDLPAPDKGLTEAARRIQPVIGRLASPGRNERNTVQFQMLGFSQQAITAHETIGSIAKSTESFSNFQVGMVAVAGDGNRYVVIDQHLYREGDALIGREGAVVHTILPDKVLVAGRDVRQWLEVRSAIARMMDPPKVKKVETPAPTVAEEQPTAEGSAKGPTPLRQLSETMKDLQGVSDVLQSLGSGMKDLFSFGKQ